MTAFFHVSTEVYKAGTLIGFGNSPSPYHQALVPKGYSWVDTDFDKVRPDNAPPRTSGVYAFESLQQCYHYARLNGAKKHFYAVTVVNPWLCPLRLDGFACKLGQASQYINPIAKEYWGPNRDSTWSYLEAVGTGMEIVEEVDPPSDQLMAVAIWSTKYIMDHKNAQKRWP